MTHRDSVTALTGSEPGFSTAQERSRESLPGPGSISGESWHGFGPAFRESEQSSIAECDRRGRRQHDHSRRFKHLQPPPGWTKADGCWVLGCGRPLAPAHGMCWPHLKRVYRKAAVLVYVRSGGKSVRIGPREAPHSQQRIVNIKWELATNWTPCPMTGCWLWLGRYNPKSGYALVGNSRDPWSGYAHRAILHFRGETLEKTHFKHTRHTCRQPACVNPDHIVYGTAKENMADRSMHYRLGVLTRRERRTTLSPEELKAHARARYLANPPPKRERRSYKLSEADREAIRSSAAAGEAQRTLADRFNITQSTVSRVISGTDRRPSRSAA